MKAFCLAFALLLGTIPATAQELPQVSNASELAQPGSYQWAGGDDNGAPLQTNQGGVFTQQFATSPALLDVADWPFGFESPFA